MDKFIEELLSYNSHYDVDLISRAYARAEELHKEQRRRSGEPYIVHPMAVAKILAEIGIDSVGIAAGILHDVVEDTKYTVDDVREEFGPEIALIVDGVTKLTSFVYESKEERQAETIRKMFLAMSKDIRVLIIKLADRLHNMRTIEYMTPSKIREKSRETLEIYAPLAARLGMFRFKFELEDIAFKNLEPEAYRMLDEQMKEHNARYSQAIERIIGGINDALAETGIKYEVYGRSKHYYSIYKKMKFQNKELNEIFDLTAVRIIVDTVKDCYAVLGIVHTMWTPIPGRFKDYIAMPKPNMYQSLHTTVIGSSGEPFEIQIRTREMHLVAEYGIAAHWKYKEGIEHDDEEVKLAWLRQTLEWQNEIDSSQEFVEAVKMDLFSNQVFVFSPKGDVMELPAGSTPIDFVFKIHSAIGNQCVGAKVNGKMVPINYELKNGEIVEIITNPNSKGPSTDWLKIVKTSSAKTKIRQFLKKENKSANADRGREALEKAARRKGYDPEQILINRYLDKAQKAQSFSTLDDMFISAGFGGSALNRTLLLCAGYYHAEKQAELKHQEMVEAGRIKKAKNRPEKTRGVTVKGVDNLLIHFAKCCNPVPGDEIIGYTTKGRGVSVHRKDCVNILAMPEAEQGRLIDVDWELNEEDGEMYFDASLSILAEDRKGLMADVSRVCEDCDVNIVALTCKTDKAGSSTIDITLSISNTNDIEKLQSRFRQVRGVADVYRANG